MSQPLTAIRLTQGEHAIDCRTPETPTGRFAWRAAAFDAPTLEYVASVGAGVGGGANVLSADSISGGDLGPPCTVAADEHAVFLGWQRAKDGHEVVALDATGRVSWGYHHGPQESGVRALSADGGAVFVLGGEDGKAAQGGALYKLDAKTGTRLPWDGQDTAAIAISSLWPPDARVKPDRADSITAKNGRLYLTFAKAEFIAVLDARTGRYVTTLSGPQVGQVAFSTTPMTDPENPGRQKVVDFGIAAIAGNGLAYFIMEHDPAWVMMSTTRWLQADEKIVALALRGDTMKSDRVTIYTALGEPQHQVQLRSAETVEGFQNTVGEVGGRLDSGPWQAERLQDIQQLAIDASGRLWITEGRADFGRITAWQTEGTRASLQREIFGPFDAASLTIDANDPLSLTLGGLDWRVDLANRSVVCLGKGTRAAPPPSTHEYRGADGLLLWKPATEARAWSTHRFADGSVGAWLRHRGAHFFRLRGLETAGVIASGQVTISR